LGKLAFLLAIALNALTDIFDCYDNPNRSTVLSL